MTALTALEAIGFTANCPVNLHQNAYIGQPICHMQQLSSRPYWHPFEPHGKTFRVWRRATRWSSGEANLDAARFAGLREQLRKRVAFSEHAVPKWVGFETLSR